MKKNNELCSRKNNEIIQNYAWYLSKAELKVFEYLCCCFNTGYYDEENNTITTSLDDFAKDCNILDDAIGGNQYNRFKAILKSLSDKSVLVENEESGGIIRIISEARWKKKDGKCICYMTQSFKEFLTQFPKGYTFTELKIINKMQSKYTINLYYLIQSWSGEKKITLDIDYLRNKLQVPKSSYDNIGKFKQILDKSVAEYNEVISYYDKLGDKISYEIVKNGKKYSSIVFYLSLPADLREEFIVPKKSPLQLSFENDEDREAYITEWISWNYGENPDAEEKYYMLYHTIPEQVHCFEKYKVDAICSVAREYAKILVQFDYIDDINANIETLINRFNIRKWYHNYENKVNKDVYLYYLKSFECWCEQQKQYKSASSVQSKKSERSQRNPNYDIDAINKYANENTDI